MDEIRRQDRKIFLRELRRTSTLIGMVLSVMIAGGIWSAAEPPPVVGLCLLLVGPLALTLAAYNRSVNRRFIHQTFDQLWEGCRDRHARFEAVLTQMRRERVADLQEMPKTIKRVAESLYVGLRKADMITADVRRTEQDVLHKPPAWSMASKDKEAQELYQVADRNIAEYRQLFGSIMARVQRTEAQAAVFMTTVDSLRVKMIGYRLAETSPELPHQDFLSAMNEAKVQLHAIDRALEELDFGQLTVPLVSPPAETTHSRTTTQ